MHDVYQATHTLLERLAMVTKLSYIYSELIPVSSVLQGDVKYKEENIPTYSLTHISSLVKHRNTTELL